jgi:hypothetical protein
MKLGFKIFGGFIAIIVILFIIELTGVGFFKFFAPMKENVRREVFENTKSYTHGKIQDLARYYQQYNEAKEESDREVIRNVIKTQFSDFDETKINNPALQQFLIKTRGY